MENSIGLVLALAQKIENCFALELGARKWKTVLTLYLDKKQENGELN